MNSIGKSYQGQDLWVLELTNTSTKPAADKPAYYIDGGVHACELASSEQVLYLAWYFATRHGQDPARSPACSTPTPSTCGRSSTPTAPTTA